ncbi:archaetidylserine decarboxylase [Psychrobacter sp. I-STPA10]|uniref:archaetidylserine decarboxylase n=1 Tax=Psychrobacter sp. I-STPA10 TaxID=2585769 RepID=UPI001E34A309|nr:archaetidylserine decarboxylase [Psychrobacter sp. I-STPA10]
MNNIDNKPTKKRGNKKAQLFTTSQYIVPQQLLSKVVGKVAASKNPLVTKAFVHTFAKVYGIKMNDYARPDLDDYDSFNDFFTRELADNARPIDQTPNGIVSPADGMVSQIGRINREQILQAKGREYDIGHLLASIEEGRYFQNGTFATVYLAPSNYHRVHMPFDGTLIKTRYLPGTLFSVNNTTADNVLDLFARNERMVCLFDTEFGTAAVVLVGAMIVAGIETVATGKMKRSTTTIQEQTHHIPLKKGDELGRFYLGSTAIVILPEAANTQWQVGLQHESVIKMGELMGTASVSSQKMAGANI